MSRTKENFAVDVNSEYVRKNIRASIYSTQELSFMLGYKNKTSLSSNLSQRRMRKNQLMQLCQLLGIDYSRAAYTPKKAAQIVAPVKPVAYIKPQKNDVRQILFEIADHQKAISLLMVEAISILREEKHNV